MITRIASHHVVDRDGSDSPATITVEAGRIRDVSEGIDPKAELVDEWLLPGYVDTHCHGGRFARRPLPPQPGVDDSFRIDGDRSD